MIVNELDLFKRQNILFKYTHQAKPMGYADRARFTRRSSPLQSFVNQTQRLAAAILMERRKHYANKRGSVKNT